MPLNRSDYKPGESRVKAQHYLLASLIYIGIASSPVFAQSAADSRIQKLEESISALERRVASLEAQLRERPPVSHVAPDKANWRKLKRGMSESDVEQLLGSPERIDARTAVVEWSYPGYGSVSFDTDSHRLSRWSEPSN
jgi:hypothetical protein